MFLLATKEYCLWNTINRIYSYWDTKRIYKYAGSFQRLQLIDARRIPSKPSGVRLLLAMNSKKYATDQ